MLGWSIVRRTLAGSSRRSHRRQTRSGSYHHQKKGCRRPRMLRFQSVGSSRYPIIASGHGRRTLPDRLYQSRYPDQTSIDAASAFLRSGSGKRQLQSEPDLLPLPRSWPNRQVSAYATLASNPLRPASDRNSSLSSRTRLCESLCQNRSMILMIFLCKTQRSHRWRIHPYDSGA